jgi:hypothetical protein
MQEFLGTIVTEFFTMHCYKAHQRKNGAKSFEDKVTLVYFGFAGKCVQIKRISFVERLS